MANLVISDEVSEALKEVRNDKSELNFAVVGYQDAASNTVALFGKGGDGVDGMRSFIKEDDVCYCLLRVDFTYEAVGNIKSETSRFLFIYYRPESLPLKRKMMLGSAEGKIKSLFSPFIKAVEIDKVDVLTTEWVKDLIDSITMTKDKTTEKKAEEGIFNNGKFVKSRNAQTDSEMARMMPDSRASFTAVKGADVTFEDEEEMKKIMQSVRNDGSQTTWCWFSYKDKKTIGFESSGEGDVDEMLNAAPTDKISYGLFRLVESYDSGRDKQGQKTIKIDQVKFGFITMVPSEGISPVMKAVVSTHKGAVVEKFRPFHNQFYIQDKSELNNDKVSDAFASLSGVKSNVTDRKAVVKEAKYERKFLGGATNEVQKLNVEDKEALDEALKEVRNDSSEIVFALAGFEGDKKNLVLKLKATGTSVGELVDALQDDQVQYALVRSTETIDGYDTTKFHLIKYEGPSVSITVKGAAGVFHGAVTEVFGQAHSYTSCGNKDEVTAKFSV